MGWLWRSSNGASEGQNAAQSSTQAAEPSPSQPSPTISPSDTSTGRALTRDEQAEAEFQAFISKLRSQQEEGYGTEHTSPSSSAQAPPPPSVTSSRTPSQTTTTDQEPPSSISPYALVPKTMSCRTSFDYAFFCQSFGGQWVNVYRYGTLRDCSNRWDEFWFCMRTMGYPAEEKEEKIAEYHRKKISERYGRAAAVQGAERKPNSEDVWEMRRTPVRGAFEGDFVAMEKMMKEKEIRDAKGNGNGG